MDRYIMKCPVCNSGLNIEENLAVCEKNHSFDRAKQGYFNMLLNTNTNKIHGDTKQMLEARRQIFQKKYYEEISNQLNSTIKSFIHDGDVLLDIGSGVGYYLNKIAKEIGSENQFYGIDISKDGIKQSAKESKDIQYIVGSNSNLPFLDQSIDIITNVFSPLYPEECIRILKNKGYLIVVNPNQNHLIEMKKIIYQDIILKEEERNELKSSLFNKVRSSKVTYQVTFEQDDLKNILLMTPHYWKSTVKGKDKLYRLCNLTTTIDIKFDVYQKI